MVGPSATGFLLSADQEVGLHITFYLHEGSG